MAHVNVTVNGRKYKMGCRDGEQRRVLDLADQINTVVQTIKGEAKLVPDDRLFLMAAIVMADQLADMRDELQRAVKTMSDFRAYQGPEGGPAQQQAAHPRASERDPIALKRETIINRQAGS